MFRDRKPESDQSKRFVWNSAEQDGQAEAPEPEAPEAAAPAPRESWPARHGRALVAAAVIVPLAGGAVGLAAYYGGQHGTAMTVAEAAQESVGAKTGVSDIASSSPSPSLSPSKSPSPSKSATPSPAAPASTVTVVKTVAAPVTRVTTVKTAGNPLVGSWPLNHSADDLAGAHNGTAHNVSWDGGAGIFSGSSNSFVGTSGPVLDTGSGKSFTVSASVFLVQFPTAPHYADTAVSQDGAKDSGFYLQYVLDDNRWAFSRVATDTTNPATGYRAEPSGAPQLNTWTHLVGVYNGGNGQMSLYVNGTLQGTAKDPTPFASNGALAIGRAFYNGTETDGFDGLITEVQVYDVALSASQVSALN
jgi:hypothetical protein